MDLISVIVPVFKTEAYLRRCVESICRQSYKNLEIILINDGSPDGCPQICEELKTEDNRIRVIHQKNAGLGITRNVGLSYASGKYVTFIDSDDWISEDHIAKLHDNIVSHKADAVIGAHTSVLRDGTIQVHNSGLEEKVYTEDMIVCQIVLPLFGTGAENASDVQIQSSSCMNLYCTDVIERHHLRFVSEKEIVAEDLFFNIDYFMHSNRVSVLNESGYFYFENMGSTSRKYDELRFVRTCRFYELMKQKAHDYELAAENRVKRTFLMKIRVTIRLISNSELSFRKKITQIHEILDHKLVKSVLATYPIESFAAAQRIFALLMKNRCTVGVFLMIKFRDSIGRMGIFKGILSCMGVGKE